VEQKLAESSRRFYLISNKARYTQCRKVRQYEGTDMSRFWGW
jgi:hypothetical protein